MRSIIFLTQLGSCSQSITEIIQRSTSLSVPAHPAEECQWVCCWSRSQSWMPTLLKEAKGFPWMFILTLAINFCRNFNTQCYTSTSQRFCSLSQDLNLSSKKLLCIWPLLFFLLRIFVSVLFWVSYLRRSSNAAKDVATLSQRCYFTLY